MLKNVAQLVHTRHRSVHNFLINLLVAMGACCFFLSKPAVNFDYEVPNSDGRLTIGNSSNPIFTEAHQAATFMVARHYIRIRITPFQSTIIPNSRC